MVYEKYKELIIVSKLRSNLNQDFYFLSNETRMNVAATRDNRLFVLKGDSGTFGEKIF